MNREERAMLVLLLRAEIEKMTDSERVEIIDLLMSGYCTNCGEIMPCCCRRHD